jgi:hypothetical protein
MYNITLISTRHEEIGLCSSYELYKIIEGINPEVIFEEIPPSFFDQYYASKTRRNLETDTINNYLETHKIEHILVDSDDVPSVSFFEKHANMMGRVEGLTDINGFNYRNLIDRNSEYIAMYGFRYLNSAHCVGYNDGICDAVENGLKTLNNDSLFQTYKSWNEVIEKREHEMLRNIYRYSREHSYDRAVFTLGAGHRRSIIEKMRDYGKNELLKLNWTFYDL